MAKAKCTCTCKNCGAEFIREKTCRNRTEANDWENWAVNTFDECPKCYGERMRKEEEARPLTISVSVSIYPPQILLTAGGNTREHKEKLKAAGYHWGYADEGGFLGMLSMTPRMTWQKVIPLVDKNLDSEEFKDFLTHEFEQIDKLGAIGKAAYTQTDLILCGRRLSEVQKENAEKQAAIDKLEKPERPDWLPKGRWNGKIYGSARTEFSVYIDNCKVTFSQDQKKELMEWLNAKEKFKNEVEKIKNGKRQFP